MDDNNNVLDKKDLYTSSQNDEIQITTLSSKETSVVKNPWKTATLIVSTALVFSLAFGVLWVTGVVQIVGVNNPTMSMKNMSGENIKKDISKLPSVMPVSVKLPIVWNNIGQKLINTGVIDEEKFNKLYESRGGMSEMMKSLLSEDYSGDIVMTKENAQDFLNIFWAFGIGNSNSILSEGPMVDKKYGGDSSRFASTGGWPLSTGNIKDHYNRHVFISLTPEQQARVEIVSKGIFRPCCNNATYFPDCNHGMAMLGLLEMMAVNGTSEEDMFDVALAVNTYWFSSTYETIAQFLVEKGTSFDEVKAKDILGAGLSSASGFQAIKSALAGPVSTQKGGGGCSV